METATGPLSTVITKLGDLLVGEYNLQKAVKGEIMFLQAELETLQKIFDTQADQLDTQDKIWATDLRELSYDIEDSIDTFMVCSKSDESAKLHGMRKYIDQSFGFFGKAKIRHGIASESRDNKTRVVKVHEWRRRYHDFFGVDKPINGLVGIDETREELIKILMEEKIVSIVGDGGLGKTTLARAVYEKISAQFDCYAFVSVSRTPDLKQLFKDILYQLDRDKYDASFFNETFWDDHKLISELREFLGHRRYFVIIDDLWDISVWKTIKCALPVNNFGYVIITTRLSIVAREAGGVYNLKPLSLSDSQKLFYTRMFGNEKDNIDDIERCIDDELPKVSERILEKCHGLPLAITAIASLLTSKARNKSDWHDVYNSIDGFSDNTTDKVDEMRKILSLSYYDLPSHLRTCFLYLSMFPGDYKIEKDRLIWMWIAEGFIQCEKRLKSQFAVGENYFSELINRNMIQPIYDRYTGLIYACRVHDVVLDFICVLSREEKLVTILNDKYDKYYTSPSNMFGRLSLQYGMKDNDNNDMPLHTTSMEHVRSAIVFPSAFCEMPVFTKFKVLRVLNLQDCDLSRYYSLEYLENLFLLRYLGLCATHIAQLPEEIGNLELIQTLDVRGNNMFSLPPTVVQLTNLMCLYIDEFTRVPNGIGNLTNLEVLSTLDISVSIDIIEELGQLMELRVLHILLSVGWSKLVESLSKLQNIQYLYIKIFGDNQWDFGGLDAWVAPQHLCRLDIEWPCWFSTLPAWMNESYLFDLVCLSISVKDLGQVNLETLGKLLALRLLKLSVDPKNLGTLGGFIIGAGLFPCLVFFQFGGSIGPIVFQQGAMLRLDDEGNDEGHHLDNS